MRNYLKILTIATFFVVLSQSCTEKQNLQNNEFEFQNVLKDNKSLLNEVKVIVNQYDKNAHNLRLEIIGNKNCSEIKHEFINISNTQKEAVWKDRIISDLKNKHFNSDDYYYLTKVYDLIDSKAYVIGSKENEQVKAEILSLWKKSIKENIKTSNLALTLLSLTDSIKKPNYTDKSADCNCSWGGTCNCQAVPCHGTYSGCGIVGYFACVKRCIAYPL